MPREELQGGAGEAGHYHQRAIDAEAAARKAAFAEASEAGHYHQRAIDADAAARKTEQQQESVVEADPVAAFYAELSRVETFPELYMVLGKKQYIFETADGDVRWTGDDMSNLIRAVEKREQPLSDIPDAWDEIKAAVTRLLNQSITLHAPEVVPTSKTAAPESEAVQEVEPPVVNQTEQEITTEATQASEASPAPEPEEVQEAEQLPPPLPDSLGETPPPLPDNLPTTPPPLPEVHLERVKGEEELLDDLESTREAYITAHRAYLDAQKAGSFIDKIRTKITGVKPEAENDLPESLRYAKDAYDDAMRAYGLHIAQETLAGSPEVTAAAEAMAKAKAYREVFLREYQVTRRAQAETYPPAEKNLFVKGVEWWSKRSLLTKIGVTSGLVLFGGTIGAGIAAGLSGAGFAATAGGIFEKVSKEKTLDDMRDKDLDTVWNRLARTQPDTEAAFSKAEAEARKVMSEDEARRRMRELKRAAVMLAAGVLGVVTMKGIMGALTGGAESTVSGTEGGASTDATPTGETRPSPEGGAPPAGAEGLRAVPIESGETGTETGEMLRATPVFLEATPQQTTWFEMLHHTPYDGASPLDQAKMTIIQKLSEAEIMGSNAGTPVPSPLVDRVIQSVFGGASSVDGWQAAAQAVSDAGILEQIKAAQAEAMADPSKTAMAEATIRALFTR